VKRCTKCKQEKELSEFCNNKAQKDGLNCRCKSCVKEYQQINKQKIAKRAKKWQQNHRHQRKEYLKDYSVKHKSHLKDYLRNWKKENYKYQKQWYQKHPWLNSYQSAKQRCTNIHNNRYYCYGGRGIKFLMAKEEFKKLWFRDKAYEMHKPSIDRIDNDGNYEYSNCRFIELTDNIKKRHLYKKENLC